MEMDIDDMKIMCNLFISFKIFSMVNKLDIELFPGI